MKFLTVRDNKIKLPIFSPDATRGVVRAVDVLDLKAAGIEMVLVNTLHLMLSPGDEEIAKRGGAAAFMGWDGPLISDSGGFQVYSMIQKKQVAGKITDDGLKFAAVTDGSMKWFLLTPEKSIQVQFNLGADIMVVLDHFSPPGANKKDIEASVVRTTEWALRSKQEFDRQVKKRKLNERNRPLLIAVIQGDKYKQLRARSARELTEIGFDGYGFGGWPIDKKGNFDNEMSAYIARLIPEGKIKFALGVGKPDDIVHGVKAGWNMYDCVLPTRDGRHGRLYSFAKDPATIDFTKKGKFFEIFSITKSKFAKDLRPISKFCNCVACKTYSRSYLNHLFRVGDTLAFRLATIHNLTHYSTLIKLLRKQ